MPKMVPVDAAVGMVLPHDVTEIRAREFKGPAFRKGHIIRPEDIEHLKRLGKDHVFILELGADEIHEDEAAILLAEALCGPGVTRSLTPVEGKISFRAFRNGLLRINAETLYQLNLLGDIMCATLHNYTPVQQGECVAATRLIPLVAKRELVEQARMIALSKEKILQVLEYKKCRVGLVIVGNEVFYKRIEDRFAPILTGKLAALGSEIIMTRIAPDDAGRIAEEIQSCLEAGADLIVTTGGMSVDPDDVTRTGIARAGATDLVYGTPVLPGAMFLVATIGDIPVLGIPACGMFHKITIFDSILPRILTGEKITREKIAALGHGGLCRNCAQCVFPVCGFCR